MNGADIILMIMVTAAFIRAVVKCIRSKKQGTGCCGSCGNCSECIYGRNKS